MNNLKQYKVLRFFLDNPLNPNSFNEFFKECYGLTKSYLFTLKSSGWRLPLEKKSLEESIEDLAYDVLEPFLISKSERPFYVIYDYFKRHRITDFSIISDDELESHFKILLQGFIKKQLSKIRKMENPQEEKLKRKIKYSLEKLGAVKLNGPSGQYVQIYLKNYQNSLRNDKPDVTVRQLKDIVGEAFCSSKTNPQWCEKIFGLLNENSRIKNVVVLSELISIMIQINAEFVFDSIRAPYHVDTPRDVHTNFRLTSAIEKSLKRAGKEEIDRFVMKGKLTKLEGDLLMKACGKYLEDKHLDGGNRPLPDYFLEFMPDVCQDEYLKKYKYMFETLISSADRGLSNFL